MRLLSIATFLSGLLCLCWLQLAGVTPNASAAEPAGGVTILQTRQWTPDGKTPTGTIWRSFQTWRTDVARTEKGELVNVNPLTPRAARDAKGQPARWNCALPGYALLSLAKVTQLELYPAKEVHGSAWPAAGWQTPDFDDGSWTRDPFPQRQLYSLVALRCLRGKFEVTDPAKAGELSLTVRFRGGAVAYVNGKEVGREFLPKGEIKQDTLAEDYPKEAYVDAEGVLIERGSGGGGRNRDLTDSGQGVDARSAPADSYNGKSAAATAGFKSRCRKMEVKIPASLLRKGTNVLAVEIHRSPAWEGMFTSPGYYEGKKSLLSLNTGECYWDRCDIEDIKLTAPAGGSVVPNVAPPKGLRVWNHPADVELDASYFADPNETVQPVRLRGLKNGSYSGQLVVSSSAPIKGLNVQVTDLKGTAGSIPATAVTVAYPHLADGMHGADKTGKRNWPMFDVLEPRPPAEVGPTPWGQNRTFPPMQPVWLTVRIPRDAKAGAYRGTVTVNAEGGQPITTPLDVEVVGDFCLPDPQAFTTYMGFLECPDAVAKQYKVELWSDEHWTLLDQVFAVLAQVGTKEIFIPMVAKTHMGNPNSMVRWVKQADGSYKPDMSIAEKYIDTALKHLGKIPVVCLYMTNYENLYQMPHNDATADQAMVTEYDPATKTLKELLPPKWGTQQSRDFWKPAIDQMRAILAKHGVEKSMMFGYMCNDMGPGGANNPPNYMTDLWAVAPGTRWLLSSHLSPGVVKADKLQLKTSDLLGSHSWVHGLFNNVMWMDEDDSAIFKLKYGWRDRAAPYYMLVGSRSRSPTLLMDHCANVNRLRIAPEASLLSQGTFTGMNPYQGLGSWGADFWGGEHHIYEGRFGDCGISESTEIWMVGAGESGPVPSCRIRMLQEGMQEAETRIFVQNAILDADQKAKLSPDLAARCKTLCDERTRALSYVASFRYSDGEGVMPRIRWLPDATAWDDDAAKLYKLADEVAKALGRPLRQ